MRSIRVVLGVTALILLLVLVPGVMAAGLTQTIDSTQISEATIIGTPQVGNTLTAEVGPSGATVKYQWYTAASADGTGVTTISGATSLKYTPSSGDIGRWLSVSVTGTGVYSGVVSSDPVGPVVSSQTITGVTVTGTAVVGDTLTGAVSPSDATVSYQWYHTNGRGPPVPTPGANSPTYTLGPGDVGNYISVTVDGTGSYTGKATSYQVGPAIVLPIVTSISPSQGPIAGGTAVTITGTGFTGATEVDYQSTADSSWTRQLCPFKDFCTINGDTSITVTTPKSLNYPDGTTVDLQVKTNQGSSAATPADQFTWKNMAPTITSISPAGGPVKGGTSITITGTGFTRAQYVAFADGGKIDHGTPLGTNFVVNSDTSITVTSPDHFTAGPVDLIVSSEVGTNGPMSPVTPADVFTYGPAVTGISPAGGPVKGGTSITITGTGFTGAQYVAFADGGKIDHGTPLGTNFMVNSDTSITVTSPDHFTAGPVDLIVSSEVGTNGPMSPVTPADVFTYGPAVTGISPAGGPVKGGTSITITGTGFTGAQYVAFADGGKIDHGTPLGTNFMVNSDTSITVTSPDHFTAGPVDLIVSSEVGTNGPMSPVTPADVFTYGPAVTGISPAGGPIKGGTSITITGTGFTGAQYVAFADGGKIDHGTPLGTNFVVNSDTSITVTSPDHFTAGPVDLIVSSEVGTNGPMSPVTPADVFTYGPAVTGISPAGGPIKGGTSITITGTGFTGAQYVAFADGGKIDHGTPLGTNFVVNSDTSITVTSPDHFTAGPVDLIVSSEVGTNGPMSPVTPADVFTYNSITSPSAPAPTVTGISPSSGPVAGGIAVTITGTNLSGATGVNFGSTASTDVNVEQICNLDILGFCLIESPNYEIIATAPANAAGTVDVTVISPDGTSATSTADQYMYNGPVVTPSPVTTATQSQITGVTISGTPQVGSVLTAEVLPSGATGTYQWYTEEGIGMDVESTSIPGATSSTYTPVQGDAYKYLTVSVTSGSTTAVSPQVGPVTVSPAPAPVVTGISPASGTEAGGTGLTITGTNFAGATAVKFGTTPATIQYNTGDSIGVSVPFHNAGTVNIIVITSGGGPSATSPADEFTYTAPPVPTVTRVTPVIGPVTGGTAVTITGTGFTGATGVNFGTTTVPVVVYSSTVISATAPAEAAGTVDITVTTLGGTSATSSADVYTYVPTPIAAFTLDPETGSSPLTVSFTDLSSYATQWDWNFGDGTWFNTTSESAKNPVHVYVMPGNYKATLIACNAAGCNVSTPVQDII